MGERIGRSSSISGDISIFTSSISGDISGATDRAGAAPFVLEVSGVNVSILCQ